MTRRRTVAIRGFLVAVDVAVLFVAVAIATSLRFSAPWHEVWSGWLPRLDVAFAVLAALAVVTFWLAGLYRLRDRWAARREWVDVFRAMVALGALTLALLYLLRLEEVSRLTIAGFFMLSFVGVGGVRMALRGVLRRYAARGRDLRQVVIVGGGSRAEGFVERIRAHPELGLDVLGYLAEPDQPLVACPRLGDIHDLPEVLASEVVDEVAICLPFRQWDQVDQITRESEAQGKAVRIPVDVFDHAISRGRLDSLAGLPVLSLTNTPDQLATLAVKRMVDVAGSVALLLLTAPILLVSMVVIWATDGRPVLFTQPRGGFNGRVFNAYKLRTMVRDAEARKAALADCNERVGQAFKLADDPRVTPVGRWLRRSSVDELLQLVNVVRGEMSLVGPRPQPVEEVAAYDPWHRRRLSVRPGLTGLWQVTARHESQFDRWVELDLAYIDNWSLWLDLKLLAKTPAALVRDPGE